MRRRELVALLAGTTTGWPLTSGAQQKAMPVIGFLGVGSPGWQAPLLAAFREGLSQTGWVEGQNVTIEYRWAEGHSDRLPALAADLVNRKVDVIAAMGGTPIAVAAKGATSTIPIVFSGGDPLERGLVASLARPGGNLTGISSLDLSPKRFEIISELVPGAKLISLLVNLVNPNNPFAESATKSVQEAARPKGVRVQVLKASIESEIDAAFTILAQTHAEGLIQTSDALFNSRLDRLVALASRHAVPTIYAWREYPAAGGLVSYGPSLSAYGANWAFMPERFSTVPNPLICRSSSRANSSWWSTSIPQRRSDWPCRPQSSPSPTR